MLFATIRLILTKENQILVIIPALIFLAGLVALSWSADRFVFGASALAKNIGISPMMIGLTIVAMGSSAPEIVVSGVASLSGNIDTAVGNALGSNITNIALVLGLTALCKPLMVTSLTLKREMPILLLVNLLAVAMLSNLTLSRLEGIVLISLFFLVLLGMAILALKVESGDPLISETESEVPRNVSNRKAIFWVIVGLIMLPISAQFIVDAAVQIARYFGLSDLVIGLTIVALGTSLPELAASIAGVLKGEDDMAMGNIIGSNIFNLLAVLAMPGLLAPGVIDPDAAGRDAYAMLILTVMLLLFSFGYKRAGRINRLEAAIFLASYGLYQYIIFNGQYSA